MLTLEAARPNGEERVSQPPGVVVNGLILYSSFLLDPVPCLVWLAWADREIPAQKISSKVHGMVWLSC